MGIGSMKILLTGILGCALVIVVEISNAGAQQPPAPAPTPSPVGQQPSALDLKQIEAAGRMNGPREIMNGDPVSIPLLFAPTLEDDKEIAGLPKGSRPAILTWERIYRLALARAGSEKREGVPDFAQFRKAFCAEAVAAGERFRDPTAAVLDLLGQLEAIDNARRNIEFHENFMKLLTEKIQGEASGLRQLDVDAVAAALVRARQKRADKISQFRDNLDELKVVLGLSPRVEFILQRPSPAAFRAVRDGVDNWNRKADRSLPELPRLMEGLPALGEVVVDGQPILAKLDKNPDLLEEILTRTALFAIKNRSDRDKSQAQGDAAIQLELRVRRRLRKLLETRSAYEREKRSYELAIRLRDQTFERMVGPPTAVVSPRSLLLNELIDEADEFLKIENRLVGLWTSFRIERLALYRDLGVLPYEDWSSFYADLTPRPGAAEAVHAATPPPAAGAAIPPPAPPGRP
jgi:hypothetical protein